MITKWIIHPIQYFYWNTLFVIKYYKKEIISWNKFVEHYYLVFFIALAIIPWISKIIILGVFCDILTYLSFVILVKDKIGNEKDLIKLREKTKQEIEEDILSIKEFLDKNAIKFQETSIEEKILKEISILRDYRYFNDNRYKYITRIIASYLKNNINEVFSIQYIYISEIQTKFRTHFLINDFDKKQAYKKGTKENYLIRIIDLRSKGSDKLIESDNNLSNLSDQRIAQLLSIEFGEKVTKENIDKII